MAENGKSGCLSWIIILVILGLIGSGIEKCSNSSSSDDGMTREEKKEKKIALAAYDDIINYCLDNYSDVSFGSQTGYVPGDARFKYNLEEHTITVTYTALYDQATEIGRLSKLSIENSCGLNNKDNYYPVSIQGYWQPEGSGGGDLVITLSKDSVLHVFIFGSSWKYWAKYSIKASENVISIFNKALEEKAKINNTEYSPLQI